ncbi:hypothetical protein MTYM_01406 [Methylococcales bacterium]|nr:hypothetical protein MTYM_01406 [Methylococcales bacterium]
MLERNFNKILVLATFLVVMFSQGCGHRTIKVNKDFAATGGSRSDGVIKLSYEYKYNEEPIVNMQQG